jgi:hypothetical protein
MFRIYWLCFAAFACGSTYLWAFKPQRLTLTTSLAAASWSLLALTANTLEIVKSTGSGTTTIDVPVGENVQLFLAGLALLSFIAFVLVQTGGYPPEQTNIPDQESGALNKQ